MTELRGSRDLMSIGRLSLRQTNQPCRESDDEMVGLEELAMLETRIARKAMSSCLEE